MNAIKQQLDRLWSIHEIRQLVYRYAYAWDTRDVELHRSLWSKTQEPARMPVMDYHFFHSPEYERAATEAGRSTLFVCNHLIDLVSEDRAYGTVYCLVQGEMDGGLVDQSIAYQDHYVREDGRWMFESRAHLLWFGELRSRNPYEQEQADWPMNNYGKGTLPLDFFRFRGGVPNRGAHAAD